MTDLYEHYKNKISDLEQDVLCLKAENKRLEKRLWDANNALKDIEDKLQFINLSMLSYLDKEKVYDVIFTDGIIDSYFKKWRLR